MTIRVGDLTVSDLVGGWLLEGWDVRGESRVIRPYGDDPSGLLIYSSDGWMTASVARSGRTTLDHPNPRRATVGSQAEAFAGYFSYAGRFRLDGSTVVHQVTVALDPAMAGTEQRRSALLEGDALVLGASETTRSGKKWTHELRWRRANTVAAR